MSNSPLLIRNHLHAAAVKPLLILHEERVFVPEPALVKVIGNFSDDGKGGLIAAGQCEDGGFGYLNGRGEWIVAPTLQDARNFSSDLLARFCDAGLWGYRSLDGRVAIAPRFEMAEAFNQGRAPVKIGERWRYINLQGEFAFDGDFQAAQAFSECGLAAARTSLSSGFGFIDRDGAWAIKPQFSQTPGFSRQGVAPVTLNGDHYGLIGLDGKWILKPGKLHIWAFNAEGYAYCSTQDISWEPYGYIDTSGRRVIAGQPRLSKKMRGGLALVGANEFVGLAGPLETSHHISWTTDFNVHGFTVARTINPRDYTGEWGILRTDGSFTAAPDGVLEPMTDVEGWILPLETGTPLAPYVTKEATVALLDHAGAVAYRLDHEPNADKKIILLRNAGGQVLWRSEACDAVSPSRPYFDMSEDAFLTGLDACGEITGTVDAMLAETELKLQAIASGEPTGGDDAGEDAQDDDEENEDEDEDEYENDSDDDEEELDDVSAAVASCSISRRVWRAYLDEDTWGEYEFLADERGELQDKMHRQLIAALTQAYGEPDPDPDYADRNLANGTLAWAFPLRASLAGSEDAHPEQQRLWAGISTFSDSGDGDVWYEIWLHIAPSIETLEAAMAAAPESDGEEEYDEEDEDAEEGEDEGATLSYDDWMARVCDSAYELADVPPELLDDAMADAAIEADTSAYQYLPAAMQTGERLEAMVRKSARNAAHISNACMTADALALARSLYANEPEWHRADQRRSRLPKRRLDRNSLHEVWGCLVDEKLAHDAVQAGVTLDDIPRWLRSDLLERAALRADISNIVYLDKHKITPELAVEAARERYTGLIEALPMALRTAQVCLYSVQASGTTLEFVPDELRTTSLCAAAMRQAPEAFDLVPAQVQEDACTMLIEEDQPVRQKGAAAVAGTRWHGLRAWSRLWREDYEGAIADATLALEHVPFPAHQHYIMAYAYKELSQGLKAATHASAVLSIWNSYETEFDSEPRTAWLKRIAASAMSAADDATLLAQVQANPLALSQIPQARLDAAMVAAAIAADPETVRYVPKRLMTSALYALAVEQGSKSAKQVPARFRRAP